MSLCVREDLAGVPDPGLLEKMDQEQGACRTGAAQPWGESRATLSRLNRNCPFPNSLGKLEKNDSTLG